MSFAFSPFTSPGGGAGGGGGTGPHQLLSASHIDTLSVPVGQASGVIISQTGVWKNLPYGSNGQSLVMVGGAPTWGITTVGGTTAGSGQSYATVGAAVDAGESIILVTQNTFETRDITIPRATHITVENGVTVEMSGYVFTFNGPRSLDVEGNGSLRFNTANRLRTFFQASGNAPILNIRDINLINATNNLACITDIDYARINNVLFDGNCVVCGDYNLYSDSIYRNGTLAFQVGCVSSQVAGSVGQNVVVVDSGTNCLLSDMVVA